MSKIATWLSQLNKASRIGFVASILWVIVFFVIGISEADSRRGFDLEEFFAIFGLVGLVPIILGWGIRWIRSAK